jgi:HK97 family phage prohead protease
VTDVLTEEATISAPSDFTRSVEFRAEPAGDGLTFSGYAAVYNSVTRINSAYEGKFDEQVAPGAFARFLRQQMPVLMFEHGQHPLIGSMPLGVIQRASEDETGLHIEARLSDNWLIEPVRDAVRDGAVTGMSFRFKVPKGGDRWERRAGDVDLRTLLDVDIPELGPVVFPAYEPTTAAVRSALDHLSTDLTGRPGARSAGGGGSKDGEPGNGETSARSQSLARHHELILRGVLK